MQIHELLNNPGRLMLQLATTQYDEEVEQIDLNCNSHLVDEMMTRRWILSHGVA